MKKITFAIALIMVSLLLTILILRNYKKEKSNITAPSSIPALTTTAISIITQTTAQSGSTITLDGGSTVTSRGICWNRYQSPTTSDNITSNGTGTGSFTSSLTNLKSNTTYYVRAYATNSAGTAYGNELIFTTKEKTSGSTVTDVDGNVYKTVVIGTQIWMRQNLKTAHYQNGDAINEAEDRAAWTNSCNTSVKTPAWCYYEGKAANGATYGKLYNYYAVSDPRSACPTGWHVPSDVEWEVLANYLGGDAIAGGHMKSVTLWNLPNKGADNSSGFSGLPGGVRYYNGDFDAIGYDGYWWSSASDGTYDIWNRNLFSSGDFVNRFSYDGGRTGFSIRCVGN